MDTKTGKPVRDRGELLGALASLADANIGPDKWQAWKSKGDKLLAGKGGKA